jgi:hypothetical protein
MKQVVDRIYTVLLRLDDPGFVERMDQYAFRTTKEWDEPKNLTNWFMGAERALPSRDDPASPALSAADGLASERPPRQSVSEIASGRCTGDGDPRRWPPASTHRACAPPQQQQAAIGGLVAALKIGCEFLAADSGRSKGSGVCRSWRLWRAVDARGTLSKQRFAT